MAQTAILRIGVRDDHKDWPSHGTLVADGGTDELTILHLITQQTRASLLQDMIGHPQRMPSLKELVFTNPSKSRATLDEHLEKLESVGMIERVSISEDRQQSGFPTMFYRISSDGWKLLDRHGIFVDEAETISEEYSSVGKPDVIKEYENAPRPPQADYANERPKQLA